MAVLPERIRRLSTDRDKALSEIVEYIEYMRERIEFALSKNSLKKVLFGTEKADVVTLVESGTHTSGTTILTYKKWSDGTAECWGSYTKLVAASTVDNSNYIGYPFTFVEIPCITLGLVSGGADVYGGHIEQGATNTSQVRLTLINRYTTAVTLRMNVMIKGRWK